MQFFDMGAHSFYVWLAYGVSIFSLAAIVVSSVRGRTLARSEAAKKIKRLKQFREKV